MIIGLAGAARSGKDTAGAYFVARHGYERRSFADAVRTAALAIDPYVATRASTRRLTDLVAAKGWEAAKELPDVRRLLQRVGTELGRDLFGADIWVDMATKGLHGGERVVFTDVRFANEAAAVRRLGGIVVLLERPGAGLAGQEGAHASEVIDFDVDATVANDGDLGDLHDRLDHLLGVPAGR